MPLDCFAYARNDKNSACKKIIIMLSASETSRHCERAARAWQSTGNKSQRKSQHGKLPRDNASQ